MRLIGAKVAQRSNGELVAVSRSGELAVADASGRDRERYKLPYGAVIRVVDGAVVDSGMVVATWDPHTHPVITEVEGRVAFSGMEEGLSIRTQTDEVTGLASTVVIDPAERPAAAKDMKPMIVLLGPDGKELCFPNSTVPAHYLLPPDAIIMVNDGAPVGVGDVIARIPQEGSKTRDITGGLPRVADLFEARKPAIRRSWRKFPAPLLLARKPRASVG